MGRSCHRPFFPQSPSSPGGRLYSIEIGGCPGLALPGYHWRCRSAGRPAVPLCAGSDALLVLSDGRCGRHDPLYVARALSNGDEELGSYLGGNEKHTFRKKHGFLCHYVPLSASQRVFAGVPTRELVFGFELRRFWVNTRPGESHSTPTL